MKKRIISIALVCAMLFSVIPLGAVAEDNGGNMNLSSEQLNSVVMLNYLTVLTQRINASSNGVLVLDEVYDTLMENTNLNSIDKETQYYLNALTDTLSEYRMIEVKRERLKYIFMQNQAKALREAVPNPLGLLSAVQSFSMKKIVASIVYMAVDSITSYQNATNEAELEYLKDGWALDDAGAKVVHSSRQNLLNYMIDIAHNYQIPDELTLRASDIEEFVKDGSDRNLAMRIQFLEDNQERYQMLGDYWIALVKSYYEKGEYTKCLEAVKRYEELHVGIFRKNTSYAQILPLAICSLEEVASEADYIEQAAKYVKQIEANINTKDWDLRYFAAQTYVNLYAKTKNDEFLNKAYTLVRTNVNTLVKEQQKMNNVFLSDVVEQPIDKDASKQEKKEIKQYNKMLKEMREKELPPVYEPLKLNCDLLFALAGQLDISDNEKAKIESILHQDGAAMFLTQPVDDLYKFVPTNSDTSKVSFDGKKINIPASLLTDSASIRVIVYGGDSSVFTDWTLEEVEHKSGAEIDDIAAVYSSARIKKYEYTPDSTVMIEITPMANSDCETINVQFKVESYKKIAFVTSISFSQVE